MINALDSCRREKRWDLNELRATKATAKRFRATNNYRNYDEANRPYRFREKAGVRITIEYNLKVPILRP
jgi:hypothetical protein